jgi:hypothetical protein
VKKCKICKIEKPYTDFNKNKSSADGLMSKCRVCGKQYYKNLQSGIRMTDDDRLNQIRLSKKKGMDNERKYTEELLKEIGYDLDSELSIHQQFLMKHNLV